MTRTPVDPLAIDIARRTAFTADEADRALRLGAVLGLTTEEATRHIDEAHRLGYTATSWIRTVTAAQHLTFNGRPIETDTDLFRAAAGDVPPFETETIGGTGSFSRIDAVLALIVVGLARHRPRRLLR